MPAVACTTPFAASATPDPSLTALPMVRLWFSVRTLAPLALPDYAGSMLRGAFGHALQRLAPLPHDHGGPCALKESCIYCQVFATPPLPDHPLQKFSQMPPAYVIEPPAPGSRSLAKGEPWQFSLVLFGRALDHLQPILLALQQALQRGLGPQHSPCQLLAVHDEAQQPLWIPGQGQPGKADALPRPRPRAGSSQLARLLFTTPLRLQLQNRPATRERLTARGLLIALARRWQLLADTHLGRRAPQLDFTALTQAASALELHAETLQWMDWNRYSSRQRQRMTLGGLTGPLTLQGPLAPFLDLLHLGQWLHVGKGTAFGLGQYHIQAP